MSSHHFVRDKQEPLLIVQSLCPELMELLVQLLEWSPEVIVFRTEKNMLLLESYDIQPDWIYNKNNCTLLNTNTAIKHSNISENLEFLAAALNYTRYNTVIDYRYQEFINLNLNKEQKGLTKIILADAMVLCCERQYKKWLPKDSQIVVNCGNLQCLNIDLNHKNANFVSNRKSDGFEIFLKNDFLLDVSFESDFKIVEFF